MFDDLIIHAHRKGNYRQTAGHVLDRAHFTVFAPWDDIEISQALRLKLRSYRFEPCAVSRDCIIKLRVKSFSVYVPSFGSPDPAHLYWLIRVRCNEPYIV